MRPILKLLPLFLWFTFYRPCQTPASRTFTAADYQRAEKFMPYNTTPLVTGLIGRVTWLDDKRFWYHKPARATFSTTRRPEAASHCSIRRSWRLNWVDRPRGR